MYKYAVVLLICLGAAMMAVPVLLGLIEGLRKGKGEKEDVEG